MNESPNPAFDDYWKRISKDREEAVLFLANIITKKERDLIRPKMENEPDFDPLQHMFLGMNVRNALRGAGFSYDPLTMDAIWYDWLKDAVSLPEEKVVLTDNIRMRIDKHKEFMKKNSKTDVRSPWASENRFMAIMALTALGFLIISLALH